MQGLTSIDRKEKLEILEMIANTDTDYLHEGFHVDNSYEFTRE